MACNGCAREIAWRSIGIIERQIPKSLLVVDKLTGNDLIVEPANLRKRILIKDGHVPSLGKLTFAKHSRQNVWLSCLFMILPPLVCKKLDCFLAFHLLAISHKLFARNVLLRL